MQAFEYGLEAASDLPIECHPRQKFLPWYNDQINNIYYIIYNTIQYTHFYVYTSYNIMYDATFGSSAFFLFSCLNHFEPSNAWPLESEEGNIDACVHFL